MNTPKVTIIIPTYNEEKVIESCLNSIFSQSYPSGKIDVVIIDNGSTDKTLEVVNKFPVRILYNKTSKNSIVSKRIGFDSSRSDYYMWFDADMEMSNRNWITRVIRPLVEDKGIVASLVNYIPKGDETPLTRFLMLGDPIARDPIYQFFSPSIKSTIISKRNGYYICKFEPGRIPPQGLGIFRSKIVKKTLKYQGNKLMELDVLAHLVRIGYDKFAYVEAGTYHYFIKDLKVLIKKRFRNISRNYLGQDFERAYKWFDLENPVDVLKIIFWIIYANLFIPELIVGIYKSIKYRTWIGMYQPFVSWLETNTILFGFAYYGVVYSRFYKNYIESES